MCIGSFYRSIPHRFLKSFAICTTNFTLGQLSSKATKQGLNPLGVVRKCHQWTVACLGAPPMTIAGFVKQVKEYVRAFFYENYLLTT